MLVVSVCMCVWCIGGECLWCRCVLVKSVGGVFVYWVCWWCVCVCVCVCVGVCVLVVYVYWWWVLVVCVGGSLIPRPSLSFLLLAVWKSGRGPGTFAHVSHVTYRAN